MPSFFHVGLSGGLLIRVTRSSLICLPFLKSFSKGSPHADAGLYAFGDVPNQYGPQVDYNLSLHVIILTAALVCHDDGHNVKKANKDHDTVRCMVLKIFLQETRFTVACSTGQDTCGV